MAAALPAVRAEAAPAPKPLVTILVGGRLSSDLPMRNGPFGFIQPPADVEQLWRTASLDSRTLDRMPASRLMTILPDLSPEFSKALWDAQRMSNPGYEWKAFDPTPPGETESPEGSAVVRDVLGMLETRYGLDVVLNKLFAQGYIRGAYFAELVLAPNRRDVLDLALPDPAIARYRLEKDPDRGPWWQLGQFVDGQFQSLERPTIRYMPIDPLPGVPPYGRSPFGAALFTCLMILTSMHDARRVIAQAGFSHVDFSINSEALIQSLPEADQGDPDKVKLATDKVIADLRAWFSNLEPDDATIHSDIVTVSRTSGAVATDVQGIATLIDTLVRVAGRSLKAMPITLGVTDGVSEANANRQWEMMVAGVQAQQHLVENLLGYYLSLACRARGVAARVEWRFHQLRRSEALRDAQTQKQVGENALFNYLAGWTTHQEASLAAVGHQPAETEPLLVPRMYVAVNGVTGADQAALDAAALDAVPVDEPTGTGTGNSPNGVHHG